MVRGFSAGGVGYLAVLHGQLFDQQPGLAFIPLFAIGVIAYFAVRASSADSSKAEAVRIGQVHPLIERDVKVGNEDNLTVALRPPAHASLDQASHIDLDNYPDSYHPDSSSVYSSPLEDEDSDDQDRDEDVFMLFEDSEVDPSLVLDEQPGNLVEGEDHYHKIKDGLFRDTTDIVSKAFGDSKVVDVTPSLDKQPGHMVHDDDNSDSYDDDHANTDIPQACVMADNDIPLRSANLEVASRSIATYDNLYGYPDLNDSDSSSDYSTLSDIGLQESGSESQSGSEDT